MNPDNSLQKSYIRKLLAVLFVVVICIVCGLILLGDCYTYLCEDDFSFETGVITGFNETGSVLKGALRMTRAYCMSWQGTYLSVFLYFLIGPYHRWGIAGFHVTMLIISILFMLCLMYIVWVISSRDLLMFSGLYAASVCAVFAMRNTGLHQETFFWYSGAINYTVTFSLTLLTIGLYIQTFRADDERKIRRYLIFTSIFAFLSSLGCLEVSAFNCCMLMAVLILSIERLKESRICMIPAVSGLVGAILNVLCPGNFSKSDMWTTENHTSVFDALKDSFNCYKSEARLILLSPSFILILIIVLILGLTLGFTVRRNSELTLIWLIVIVGGLFLVRFFTVFPVIFGYHSTDLDSARTKATYEAVARLTYIFEMLTVSDFVNHVLKHRTRFVSYVSAAAGCFILVFSLIHPTIIDSVDFSLVSDIRDGMVYRVASDHHDGSLRRNYDTRMNVIHALEEAGPEDDVVLYVPLSDVVTKSMYGMGISDDPHWSVNLSAATLFDVKSVTVFYTEE